MVKIKKMISQKVQNILIFISHTEKLQYKQGDADLLFSNGDKEHGLQKRSVSAVKYKAGGSGLTSDKGLVDLSGVGKWRRYCLKQ